MNAQSKTMSITYKKVPEFHSFWATKGAGHQWLFVNAANASDGIKSVIANLNEYFGGEWQAARETLAFLDKISADHDFADLFESGGLTVNTCWVQKAA